MSKAKHEGPKVTFTPAQQEWLDAEFARRFARFQNQIASGVSIEVARAEAQRPVVFPTHGERISNE